MSQPTTEVYHLSVAGGLLGVERAIGLLRRRRVSVLSLDIEAGPLTVPAKVRVRIVSANHNQVRRQLQRVLDIVDQSDSGERTP